MQQLWQTLAQRDGLLSAMKVACHCCHTMSSSSSSLRQTIKDFVLLGRGELFNAFLEQSERLLFKPVVNTSDFGRFARHQAGLAVASTVHACRHQSCLQSRADRRPFPFEHACMHACGADAARL